MEILLVPLALIVGFVLGYDYGGLAQMKEELRRERRVEARRKALSK